MDNITMNYIHTSPLVVNNNTSVLYNHTNPLTSNDKQVVKIGAHYMIVCSIEKVIFSPPATIVFWSDGTKTVVKTSSHEIFDEEKGLAMAISEKYLGNYSRFKKVVENAQRPER